MADLSNEYNNRLSEIICVPDKMEGTGGIDECNAGFADEIKKEIISESDEETSVFRDEPTISPYNANHCKGENVIITREDGVSGQKSDGTYYCHECQIPFRNARPYERHFRENHPKKGAFTCPRCHVPHKFKKNYVRHLRQFHPNEFADYVPVPRIKISKCDARDTRHEGGKALELHAPKARADVETFQCSQCEGKFSEKCLLTRHIRRQHPERVPHPFEGETCSDAFARSDDASANHETPRRKKREKNVLRDDADSRGKSYYCRECGILFRYTKPYERHFREKHPKKAAFTCVHCRVPHKFKKNYQRHVRQFHPDKFSDYRDAWLKNPELKCETCDTTHKGVTALELHALNAHKDVKTFQCPRCEGKFFRNSHLRRHVRNKHGDQIYDPFVCEMCRKSFDRSDALDRHKALCRKTREKSGSSNSDELPRRCVNGGKFPAILQSLRHERTNGSRTEGEGINDPREKTFDNNRRLENQGRGCSRRVSGGKKHPKTRLMRTFVCKICDDEFEGKVKYEAHVTEFHRNERLYECTGCGAKFRWKSNLKEHFGNAHGTKILPCSYCAKCFKSKTTLKRHERSCGKARAKKEAFFCDICSKWRDGNLYGHKKNHNYYDHCDLCHQRFHKGKNPDGLSKHREKRHPNRSAGTKDGILDGADIWDSRHRKIKLEDEDPYL